MENVLCSFWELEHNINVWEYQQSSCGIWISDS